MGVSVVYVVINVLEATNAHKERRFWRRPDAGVREVDGVLTCVWIEEDMAGDGVGEEEERSVGFRILSIGTLRRETRCGESRSTIQPPSLR
jgi:hypothetical protein